MCGHASGIKEAPTKWFYILESSYIGAPIGKKTNTRCLTTKIEITIN